MDARSTFIDRNKGINFVVFVVLLATISACSSNTGAGKQESSGTDAGEEESRTQFTLSESYDQVRNGARLILAYDAQSNSFNGTVENTTASILKLVRVEVHLSNGAELGPTTPTDLDPGESVAINLIATDSSFDTWSAHPEVGESGYGEHGSGEEGGEHGEEGESGHNEGGSD